MRVFDTSAVLAMIFAEPGGAKVSELIGEGDGAISSVNLAEVFSKLRDRGMDDAALETVKADLPLAVKDFTAEHAAVSGRLRVSTRATGLSLGDRCCLALAMQAGAEVITADKAWKSLKGFRITLIR